MLIKKVSEPRTAAAVTFVVGATLLFVALALGWIKASELFSYLLGLAALAVGIWNRLQLEIEKKVPRATMEVDERPQYTLKKGLHLLGWRAKVSFENPTAKPIRLSKIELLKPSPIGEIQAATRQSLYGPATEPQIARTVDIDWLVKSDGSCDHEAVVWIFCPTDIADREVVHIKLKGQTLGENRPIIFDCSELLRGNRMLPS